LLPLRGLPQ